MDAKKEASAEFSRYMLGIHARNGLELELTAKNAELLSYSSNFVKGFREVLKMSLEHEKLKILAKQILMAIGFAENQIFMEIPVISVGTKIAEIESSDGNFSIIKAKKTIIADVVGIKEGRSTVVECGTTPSERLVQLKLLFDEVLFLPLVETWGGFTDVPRLQADLEKFKEENAELKKTVKGLQDKKRMIDWKVRTALET